MASLTTANVSGAVTVPLASVSKMSDCPLEYWGVVLLT